MKLIKLSETHYIVIDDSEIKEGDFVFQQNFERTNNQIIRIETEFQTKIANDKDGSFTKRKIIHSTPIGGLSAMLVAGVRELPLSEVEEAIYGYSVEKMLEENHSHRDDGGDRVFYDYHVENIINTHKELVKDKFVLSLEQIHKIIAMSKMAKTSDGLIDMDAWISNGYEGATPAYSEEEIIQSLLPKTEWEVEFDEQSKLKLI